METSKGTYIEIAVGSVANRAFVIKPEELYKHIREKTELYRSLFTLDETAYVHFRDQGTIRSYKGKFSLDRIIFDIRVITVERTQEREPADLQKA